jgi:hypothetical protein
MGNHEFCTMCGASCFHKEGECNPEVKSVYQMRKSNNEKANERAKRELNKFVVEIKLLYPTLEIKINEYGHAEIPWHQFKK